MTGLVFAGSEISAFGMPASAFSETTTGGSYRASYSRGSIRAVGSGISFTAKLDSAISEGWISCRLYANWDNDGDDTTIELKDSSGVGIIRLMTPAYSVFRTQYWDGSTWVTFGSDIALTANSLFELVIYFVTGGSGEAAILINGVLVSSGPIGTATNALKTVELGDADDNLGTNLSEVIIMDGGDSLVGAALETEAPTADGTDTDGTGTYADVDEYPYNDSDFLVLASAAERHSFTSPARTGTIDIITGVSVAARMKRDASGPQSARFYLKIGGTRYYGTTFALTLGMDGYQYAWPTNPATGTAWTTTDAEAAGLEWGIEAVA